MSTESIVGMVVKAVEISQDKGFLRFTFADGTSQMWSAVGDCCSHSWFEHVDAFDFSGTVLSVEHADGEVFGGTDDGDCTQIYFTTIKTNKGRLHIELRNHSNGYYGGWIQAGDGPIDQYGDLAEMPQAWSAVL